MIRVYVVEVDDKGSDDYSDEDFKKLGVEYSLKEFQNEFNYSENISINNYIRFLEV